MKQDAQKIWLLLDSRELGGIESHVLQLADGLNQHHKQVTVVFLANYGEHPLRELLRQRGISSVSLDGKAFTLWKVLQQLSPALIHTHGYKAGVYGRIAAKLAGIPSVSTYHAGETPNGKLAIYDWLDRMSAGLASKVFAVSPQIAKRLPVPAEITDNFINTCNINTSAGEQVAFVGRLSHEKAPERFIQLAVKYPEQQFHIYGDGALAPMLKKSAPTNVIFHGLQADMSTVWQKIGLLVMPSRFEGMPMAALEAMARGIPVLASRVGALDQLIGQSNNRCGWLVSAGNANELNQCFKQWLKLLHDDKHKMQLIAQQTIMNRFSSYVAIPKLMQHYRQIIKTQ